MKIDAPAVASSLELRPALSQERVETVDVLRGLALLGVLIANASLWFSGAVFRFPEYALQMATPSVESLIYHAISIFISGKALSILAFLFGFGFGLQTLRAAERGRDVRSMYARRLGTLLLFGVLHAVLLWYGDILMAYAIFGFALLPFRKRADRTLLAWAAVLLLAVPLAVSLILGIQGLLQSSPAQPLFPPELVARNTRVLELLVSPSYLDMVRANLLLTKDMSPRLAVGGMQGVGLFLVGMWVARRGLFQRAAEYRSALRRVAMVGLSVGLTASVAMDVLRTELMVGGQPVLPSLRALMVPLAVLSIIPPAFGYTALLTLLMEREAWRRRLALFAPVGRMTLTNYLSQSALCVTLFYGAGMVGHSSQALTLAISLAVYALQLAWSHWWLARFQFGPLEWLWRSLSYGRIQPMHAQRPSATSHMG